MPADLDSAQIERAVAGDAAALEGLLRAVAPDLMSGIDIQPVWRRCLDPDDILQVSSLEAFLRIASLHEPTPAAFRAWIKRIVANNLRDAIRGLEREKRPDPRERITRGAAGESARTLLAALTGTCATPSTPAILAEDVGRLRAVIRALPKSYRRVVERMDLEEADATEVAAEMGRSRGAIHLLRSRAHDRLRELLPEIRD
jgi:RNA polymerase sigma-70 factor, ECF subfamily